MNTKHKISLLTTALVAVALVGAVPGAAFAQGRGNASWKDAPPGQKKKWDRRGDKRDDRRDERRDDRRNNDGWDASRYEAERRAQEEAQRRQRTKNDWRNLAIASGGVALYGLIKKDPYIGFAGLAGALYSLNRYEEDRKSQNQLNRFRADMFSQPYFYREGVRYNRRLVTKNGQKYYQFVRQ